MSGLLKSVVKPSPKPLPRFRTCLTQTGAIASKDYIKQYFAAFAGGACAVTERSGEGKAGDGRQTGHQQRVDRGVGHAELKVGIRPFKVVAQDSRPPGPMLAGSGHLVAWTSIALIKMTLV